MKLSAVPLRNDVRKGCLTDRLARESGYQGIGHAASSKTVNGPG